MTGFGKLMMTVGIILFLVGFFWQFIGRLPGDIVFKKGNTTFYFPVITCLVISIVLSLIFYFINKFR